MRPPDRGVHRAARVTRGAVHGALLTLLAAALAAGWRARSLLPDARPAPHPASVIAAELHRALPAARGGRLRAALVLDSRDCLAHVAALDFFERPAVSAAVGHVALATTDGTAGAARAADALLTYGIDRPVLALQHVATPRVPMMTLLAPDGRIVLAVPAPSSAAEHVTLAAALDAVASHWVASSLATGRRD